MSELTFDYIRSLESPCSESPQPPLISDYRLVAGLLFHRYNSATVRRIVYNAHAAQSTIHTALHAGGAILPVCNTCVAKLHDEGLITGQLVHQNLLQLTGRGAREVVTNWFQSSATTLDCLAAGATYDNATQELRW